MGRPRCRNADTTLPGTRDNARGQPASAHDKQHSQDRPVRIAARACDRRHRIGQGTRRRARLPLDRAQVRRAAARRRRYPVGADARRIELGQRIPHEPLADRIRLRRLRRARLPGERPDLPHRRRHADRRLGLWRRGAWHEKRGGGSRAQGRQRRDRQAGVSVPDRDRLLVGLSDRQDDHAAILRAANLPPGPAPLSAFYAPVYTTRYGIPTFSHSAASWLRL
ncbi:hypothetical protein BC2230_20247 [Burkholderia cepacia]